MNDRVSFTAILISFLLIAGIVVTLVFGPKKMLPALFATAAPTQTPPRPTATQPLAAANPTDMNVLAPEFGAWLLKHPEHTLITAQASSNEICATQRKLYETHKTVCNQSKPGTPYHENNCRNLTPPPKCVQ